MDINKVLELPEYSFIKTEKRLGKNIMLLTFGGSHSYGTNGPTSDIDIRGITAPTKEDILGIDFVLQDQDRGNNNLVFGSNGFEQYNDANTDTVIYSLDKILKLLYKCNPNTIEILGCKPEHYAYISPAGQLLLDNRHLFLSKLAVNSFSGYARQQFYRLKNALARDSMALIEKQFYIIDVINRMYRHLEEAYPTFERGFVDFYVTDLDGNKIYIDKELVLLDELCFVYKGQTVSACKAKDFNLDLNNTELRVDIKIKGMHPKDVAGVYNEISAVLKDFSEHIGHRNQKKDDYHLNKHAMHLVRLYLMCFDILEKHEIVTYREDDLELLLKIKDGYYQQEDGNYRPEFYQLVDDFERKLKELSKTTTLPDRPDEKAVQDLAMRIKQAILDAA